MLAIIAGKKIGKARQIGTFPADSERSSGFHQRRKRRRKFRGLGPVSEADAGTEGAEEWSIP